MNYLRILSRLINTPLMMADSKLEIVTNAVIIPLAMGQVEVIDRIPSMSAATEKSANNPYQSVGVIQVFDSLVSKNASAGSGMTSYEGISRNIKKQVSAGATHIVFWVDSPGGEVSGLFGLTQQIRELRLQGIQTIAYIDGMGTSAAYAISAAAQLTYASPTSLAASIAARMVHVDMTAADEKAGKRYTILRSKAQKALGSPHEALTPETLDKFNAILASMDTAFNNDVLLSKKKVTLDSIVKLEGSEIMATEALSLGLIDGLHPNLDSVLASLNPTVKPNKPQKLGAIMPTPITLEDALAQLDANTQEIAQLNSQISTLKAEHEIALSTAVSAAVTAERDRGLAIFGAADPLRLKTEVAIDHIKAGTSAEEAKKSMVMVASHLGHKIDGSAGIVVEGNPDTLTPAERKESLASSYALATGKKKLQA